MASSAARSRASAFVGGLSYSSDRRFMTIPIHGRVHHNRIMAQVGPKVSRWELCIADALPTSHVRDGSSLTWSISNAQAGRSGFAHLRRRVDPRKNEYTLVQWRTAAENAWCAASRVRACCVKSGHAKRGRAERPLFNSTA
jgi:hypothetical protein